MLCSGVHLHRVHSVAPLPRKNRTAVRPTLALAYVFGPDGVYDGFVIAGRRTARAHGHYRNSGAELDS